MQTPARSEIIKKYLEQSTGSRLTLVGPFYQPIGDLHEPLIFVDRGADFRSSEIGLAVGDGDSAQAPMDELLDREKDYSDLAYVLHQIPESFCEIQLLGFLGGRRDHELIGLGEAHHFLENRKTPCQLFFDNKIIVASKGHCSHTFIGLFSLLSFNDCMIELAGACRYPYSGKLKKLSSHGLSNEAHGEFSITSDQVIFILKTTE